MPPRNAARNKKRSGEIHEDACPREKVVSYIVKKLYDDDDSCREFASSLEKNIFNRTIDLCMVEGIECTWEHKFFKNRYVQKAIGIVCCLKNPQNKRLLDQFESGELTFHELVYSHPYELCPWIYEKIFDELAIKQIRREDVQQIASDGQFKCGKCKSKAVTYTQLQTRSADEPMTTFFLCTNCGGRWKG